MVKGSNPPFISYKDLDVVPSRDGKLQSQPLTGQRQRDREGTAG